MEPKSIKSRLIALIAFFAAVLAIYICVMFNIQIVHGEEYLEQSMSQIVKSTTVEAARGIITDRNGKTMVSNNLTYTLTFDASLLSDDTDENAAILRLVNLCVDNGIEYTDNLPISKAAPFTYTTDAATDTQVSRFNRYLKNRKFDIETMTAPELFSAMREDFDIDPACSDADARKIMTVRYELALRKLVSLSSYVMASNIDAEFITLVKDGDYLGADIQTSNAREYLTDSAAHILGRVGAISESEYADLKDSGYSINATIGKDGVESAFETFLHGTNGTRIINTNSDGKVTSELYTTRPQPGDTVELTIDLDLQEASEQLLATKIEELTREDGIKRGGAVAVVDVNTGGVLTLASYPTYSLKTFSADYNELQNDASAPLYNRATMGTYAPGSTFKPLTAIAALESGIISASTTILTKGKYTYYSDYQPACWIWNTSRGSHGLINVTEAIKVSCNYFFYEVGRLTGISTLENYEHQFGLGDSTGIEIPERTGVVAGPEYSKSVGSVWYDGNTLQAAIGQSDNLFTPLQLANYIATLVNGGTHYSAHLLKSVKSYDNSQLIQDEQIKVLNQVEISEENLNAVLSGMHQLVLNGSVSTYFKDCVVDAGAKTGSAQTGQTLANGVFVCFAPYDDPEIAVAIVIEKGGSGGALASTAVGILNSYFAEDEIGTTIIGENQLLP